MQLQVAIFELKRQRRQGLRADTDAAVAMLEPFGDIIRSSWSQHCSESLV